ncbi:MAG: putative sensor protein, partial [Frankiales bacterium]|nr:putative sensor protein [Frankiales bacterium]
VELRVCASADRLRVEVRDGNPLLPGRRGYDEQATTGRGMALVSALVSHHGITGLEAGKIVWFELDDGAAGQSEADLLAAFDDDAAWDVTPAPEADPQDAPEPQTGVRVRLPGLPTTLWLAARQHHDALLRELVLYLAEHGDLVVDLPAADTARSRVSDLVVAAVERAASEGRTRPPLPDGHPSPLPWVPDRLDLELELPAAAATGFAALQDALDAGEHLAGQGRLLVRPGLPEVVAVRDWVCEQVVSQVHGVPAHPWPGVDLPHFETATARAGSEPDWALDEALGSGRGVVAADDANRIVGVSAELARALGWEPDELVGRRVVTLIPPALREAHVAGFTRHLTTGEAHVLGVPLTLPVLHRDGSEVPCTFLVEPGPVAQGRAVYLAWIEPV